MSIQGSILIILICIIRLIFKKIPRKFFVYMWIAVAIRLMLPFSFESSFSIIPTKNDINIYSHITNEKNTPENSSQNNDIPQNNSITYAPSRYNNNPVQNPGSLNSPDTVSIFLSYIIPFIWLGGIIIFSIILSYKFILIRKFLNTSEATDEKNIFETEYIDNPFVFGIFRPYIYIPKQMNEKEKIFVIAHEKAHIKRLDNITKLLSLAALILHWFNPIAWLFFILLSKDMEMACDEHVLAGFNSDVRQDYSLILLSLSARKSGLQFSLSFGESNTKSRIKHILSFKKPSFWIVLTGLLLLAVIFFQCIFSRKPDSDNTRNNLRMEDVVEMYRQNTLSKCDFSIYTNGVADNNNSEALDQYYVNFNLEYGGKEFTLFTALSKQSSLANDVRLIKNSTNDSICLYSFGSYPVTADIDYFLQHDISISDWLSITLPEGYIVGEYNAYTMLDGGAVIYPEAYKTYEDTFSYYLPERTYSGTISIIRDSTDCFIFEDGRFIDKQVHFWMNHGYDEKAEILDGLEVPALLCYGEFELFTLNDLAILNEKGIDIPDDEALSRYWIIYFAKEYSKKAYCISLAANKFTKEQAVDIAKTVQFTETAFDTDNKK